MKHTARRLAPAVLAAVVLAACAGGGDAQTSDTTSTSTSAVVATSSVAPSGAPPTSVAIPPTTAAGSGSTAPAPAPPPVRYPGAEWERSDAAEAGFDPAALDALADQSAAAGSTCTAVTRDGVVVDERYWDGATADTTRDAFSVTKSVTSILVGQAQAAGDLSITDSASTYIPEWAGTASDAVTVQDLLTNDSGRHWDLNTDYGQMVLAAPDKTAFAIGLGQDAAPGTVWAYNNSAVQTLSAVLKSATGEDASAFATRELFDPLGMSHTSMGADRAGNTTTFSGVQTTCLDLARFGYMLLHGGQWNGQQIVPADYVAAATQRSSSTLNAAYGYLFWLNKDGSIVSPLVATDAQEGATIPDGQLLPGASPDIFWALGFHEQIVAVIPAEGIVAVRMGPNPPDGSGFDEAAFTQGVLDALTS